MNAEANSRAGGWNRGLHHRGGAPRDDYTPAPHTLVLLFEGLEGIGPEQSLINYLAHGPQQEKVGT